MVKVYLVVVNAMKRYTQRPNVRAQAVARKPEPVTEEHIQAIADEIRADGRYPLMPTRFNRELAFSQAIDNLRRQSHGKLMSPDMFEYVKRAVVQAYYRCQAKIGMPVILIASEALISAVMQATLNTFHKSGAANDTGFSAISEVLHVPPSRKKKQVYLHFNRRMTKKDVFLKRAELVYKSVDSFVVDYEIEEFGVLGKRWFHRPMMMAQGINIPETSLVMRVHLNALDMIAHRVSITDLVRPIHRVKGDDVHFLYGSTKDGILDIVINHEVVTNKVVKDNDVTNDTFHRLYYNRYLYPAFTQFHVSGVDGVNGLYLGETNVVSALRRVNRLTPPEVRELQQDFRVADARDTIEGDVSYFRAVKRRDVMQYDGVSDDDINELIKAHGGAMVQDEDDPESFIFILPGDVKADRKLLTSPDVPDHISTHYFAVLDSAMLEDVLFLEDCDYNRTYSNNFHVMARVFGIEIARAYHFYNSMKIIETLDTTTSTRYIEAFSDVVSQRGRFMGINAAGIAKHAGGFMSRATIAEPNKIFPNAAIYDRHGESVLGSAAGITVGQPPRLGTGLSDYGVTPPVPPPVLTEEDMRVVLLSLEGERKDTTIVEGINDDEATSFADYVAMQEFVTQEQMGKRKMGAMIHRPVDPNALFAFKGDPSIVTTEVLDKIVVPLLRTGIPQSIIQQMDKYRPKAIPKFFTNPIIQGIIPPIPPFTFKLRTVEHINLNALIATLEWMRK